jgi:hypothetical protein
MSEEIIIRKEIGTPSSAKKLQEMPPLQRAFMLKIMLEDLRGKRLDSNNENVRRVVGRVK